MVLLQWNCGSELARDFYREQARSHDGGISYAALAKRSEWWSTSPRVALIMARRLA